MAHWAELDENNKVIRVIVTENNHDEGYSWIQQYLGGTWIQTSYNKKIRKNFASIGYTYSKELDAFIPPQPYQSWILNEEICLWEAPKPHPSDGKDYIWDESTVDWEEMV